MEEKNKDQLQAVWVAAGALAVMAASLAVVYSMVKQWRSWVFVFLNILLLAIVFTSKHGAFCSKSESDVVNLGDNCVEECDADSKTERKKRARKQEEEEEEWGREIMEEDCKVMKRSEKKDVEEKEKIIECDDSGKSRLTNEELNERVEAFIATFRRQYLVSDVKGKSSTSVCTSPAGHILSKGILV